MNDQKHNKRTFSLWIEKHQAIIHKITMVYTNVPADREDLFQEIQLLAMFGKTQTSQILKVLKELNK